MTIREHNSREEECILRAYRFAWFEQFQTAANGSSLAERGVSFLGLQAFYDAAAAGTLPEVSYVIGPMELSEHPPWTPHDGAWFQQQITNAVINSPKYNSTILFISYDETVGFSMSNLIT